VPVNEKTALFTERQNTTVTFPLPKKPRQNLFTTFIILNFLSVVNKKPSNFYEKNEILAIFNRFSAKIFRFRQF